MAGRICSNMRTREFSNQLYEIVFTLSPGKLTFLATKMFSYEILLALNQVTKVRLGYSKVKVTFWRWTLFRGRQILFWLFLSLLWISRKVWVMALSRTHVEKLVLDFANIISDEFCNLGISLSLSFFHSLHLSAASFWDSFRIFKNCSLKKLHLKLRWDLPYHYSCSLKPNFVFINCHQ